MNVKQIKLIYYISIGILLVIIFYLSWLPEPRLSNIWFIPKFLGQLYFPQRSADIRDVFWGGAGALCGIFEVAAIVVIRKQIFFVKPLKAES